MAPPRKKVEREGIKRKEMITMDVKQEIIKKHELGMRVADIARYYNKSTSTICTILKRKEEIKGIDAGKGDTMVSKQRPQILIDVEKLLLVWIYERQLACDTVTESTICEKAKALHADLLAKLPGMATEREQGFKASRGWFDNFKRRSDIHSAVRHEDAADLNAMASDGDGTTHTYYPPLQVLCDESGQWKKLPKRTYITAEDNMDEEADYRGDQDNGPEQEIEIEVEQPKPEKGFPCWEGKVEAGASESAVTPEPEMESKAVGSKRRKRKSIDRYMVQTAFEVLKKSVEVPDRDECDSFGHFIAKKLKGYSLHTKNYVEHLISDIIYRADRGEFVLQS